MKLCPFARRAVSPSPGTPGEGWGEGSARSTSEADRSDLARTLRLPSPGVPGEGKFALTRVLLVAAALAVALSGCASQSSPPPATQPSVASGRPPYWLRQAAVASVEAKDFDALWSACEEAARHFGFRPDREDFRGGVLTTEPLVSKQFWELWRNDVATLEDLANSSLATYRRTLRFDIEQGKSGGYVAALRVVIERYSRTEQPISASVYLRNAFRTQRGTRYWGNRETDRGVQLPRQYWYATGRDHALERQVAREAEKQLARS